MPPELSQSLEALERHLTTLEQAIEQLKASQDQMASDNAKAIEELKAGQEQMTRLVARTSEPNPRPRTATAPPRPVAAPARQSPSPQARAQP
jgi:chromosome segregation ATPase